MYENKNRETEKSSLPGAGFEKKFESCSEVITFSKILECWKKKEFPPNFELLLEKYLDKKIESFENVRIKDIPRWLSQVAIAIEIGMSLNAEKFSRYKEYWEALLGRKWDVDLEEVVVKWKKI